MVIIPRKAHKTLVQIVILQEIENSRLVKGHP